MPGQAWRAAWTAQGQLAGSPASEMRGRLGNWKADVSSLVFDVALIVVSFVDVKVVFEAFFSFCFNDILEGFHVALQKLWNSLADTLGREDWLPRGLAGRSCPIWKDPYCLCSGQLGSSQTAPLR